MTDHVKNDDLEPDRGTAATQGHASPERRKPTDREKHAIALARETFAKRPSRPTCSWSADEGTNSVKFGSDHDDEQGFAYHLAEALGACSPGFRKHMIKSIGNFMRPLGGGLPSEDAVNAAIAIIAGVEPQNELESIIGLQLAATNELSLELLAAAKRSTTVEVIGAYIAQATKLQRTMCTQLETLAKMRRGGEQVIRHVHVDNRGGQAVIAEHVHTGGERNEFSEQSHRQGAFGTSLLGHDPAWHGMPVAGYEGAPALQTAWRQESRAAAGQQKCVEARPSVGGSHGPQAYDRGTAEDLG